MTEYIVAITAFLSLWLGLIRPKYLLYTVIFFAPWQGLDFDIGVRLTCFRIMIMALFIVSLVNLSIRKRPSVASRTSGILKLFMFYAVTLSLFQVPFLPDVYVVGGSLRSPEARAVIQLLYFAILLSPILILPMYFRDEHDFIFAGKVFISSLLVLACLGWFQLLSWYLIGWNPFPIGLMTYLGGDQSLLREGTFDFGLPIHRMNALGGEPKYLGQGFALGLVLIQTVWGAIRVTRTYNATRWSWIVLFVSMLFTYSTSAIILWVLGSIVQVAIYVVQNDRMLILPRFLKNVTFVTLIILVIAILGWNVGQSIQSSVDIPDLFRTRTIDRLNLEDFDSATLSFLTHEPGWLVLGVGMGNVHLYADQYLPAYAVPYASGTAFRAKTGALKLLSELGIAGFFLWTLGIFAQLRELQYSWKILQETGHQSNLGGIALALFVLGCSLSVVYLALAGIEEIFVIVIGAVVAIVSLIRNHCSEPKKA
jgi:hypothetical protein